MGRGGGSAGWIRPSGSQPGLQMNKGDYFCSSSETTVSVTVFSIPFPSAFSVFTIFCLFSRKWSSASPLFPTCKSLDNVSGHVEGGRELAELTPSYIPSEFWSMCLGAMEITCRQPNGPPRLRDTRFHTKSSLRQKERKNPLCSQSPL